MRPEPAQSCQRCGGDKNLTHYHQRTQYVAEEDNWVTLCPPCRDENDAHWDAMWADYYSGLL